MNAWRCWPYYGGLKSQRPTIYILLAIYFDVNGIPTRYSGLSVQIFGGNGTRFATKQGVEKIRLSNVKKEVIC